MEDPFKVQDSPMDFNVTESGKRTGLVSDYTLQLTFKKLPLAREGGGFGWGREEGWGENVDNCN